MKAKLTILLLLLIIIFTLTIRQYHYGRLEKWKYIPKTFYFKLHEIKSPFLKPEARKLIKHPRIIYPYIERKIFIEKESSIRLKLFVISGINCTIRLVATESERIIVAYSVFVLLEEFKKRGSNPPIQLIVTKRELLPKGISITFSKTKFRIFKGEVIELYMVINITQEAKIDVYAISIGIITEEPVAEGSHVAHVIPLWIAVIP